MQSNIIAMVSTVIKNVESKNEVGEYALLQEINPATVTLVDSVMKKLINDHNVTAKHELRKSYIIKDVTYSTGSKLIPIEGEHIAENNKIKIYLGSIFYSACKACKESDPDQWLDFLFKKKIVEAIAHEYCHVLQNDRNEDMSTLNKNYDENPLEQEADKFANDFALEYLKAEKER